MIAGTGPAEGSGGRILDPRHFTVGAPPSHPSTPLRLGSKGEQVRAVQQQLKALGAKIAVAGAFGPAPRQAAVALELTAIKKSNSMTGQ